MAGRRIAGLRKKAISRKGRPRLCVFRSLKHIYAQVVDDTRSRTLAAASSLELEAGGDKDGKTKTAATVGSLVAKRALEEGVTEVVFDRRKYKYHGRVKALAEAARETGLVF